MVFAGDAHVVTPLTDDTRTIANLMPALSPTIMPLPGADATSGVEMASALLSTAGAQGGQILLMTDGLPGFNMNRAQDALTEWRNISGARHRDSLWCADSAAQRRLSQG